METPPYHRKQGLTYIHCHWKWRGFTLDEYNSKGKAIGHEKPTRRCLTTEEMLALGMLQDDKGTWRGPASPGSDRSFEDTEQEDEELAEA